MRNTSKTENKNTDFDNLVRNGIDFLEKAISQLEDDPKHSVINFYTAVEIFLKAPLVFEHWTLVVVDRKLNRKKYEEGDFISVSFEDACDRLVNTLSKPLDKSAKEAFNNIRTHRNRMVHFYHSGINGKQRKEIELEQAQAWFELNRFVTVSCHDVFEPFLDQFRQMERSLIANNHYAHAKYQDLKQKIDGMTKSGKTFEVCPSCETLANHVELKAPRLESCNCLVCFRSENRIQVDCPSCGEPSQYIAAYDGFSCNKCDHTITDQGELFELLDENTFRGSKEDVDSQTPCSCDECQGYETVCDYEEGFLCVNCLSYFEHIGRCNWCNAYMTGDTENTYVFGCRDCVGLAGHHADD